MDDTLKSALCFDLFIHELVKEKHLCERLFHRFVHILIKSRFVKKNSMSSQDSCYKKILRVLCGHPVFLAISFIRMNNGIFNSIQQTVLDLFDCFCRNLVSCGRYCWSLRFVSRRVRVQVSETNCPNIHVI